MCLVREVDFYSWNNQANQCVKKPNGIPNLARKDLGHGFLFFFLNLL